MWHLGTAGEDALRAHATRWSGAADITTGHHCPACGSDAHGRPWVRLPDGTRPWVSLARSGEHLVTAFADQPVGVDVESIAAVDARWDPALVLHPADPDPDLPRQIRRLAGAPGERSDLPRQIRVSGPAPSRVAERRAAMWCRKEAILKALGTGLRTPMSEIRVADWAVEDIPAPEGFAASVVVIAQAGRGGSSTA